MRFRFLLRVSATVLLVFVGLSFFAVFTAQADTPSINIDGFDVTPKGIPYSTSSTINYSFTLSTPSASATSVYCGGFNKANGDINWFINEKNTVTTVATGTISHDNFLSNLRILKTGSFTFEPTTNQTTANFQLVISCYGTISFSQITNSAVVPVSIAGQFNTTGVTIAFGSDKADQHVQPNSALPTNFEFDITANQSSLLSKCSNTTPSSNLTYAIYQFSTGMPGDHSNQIFGSNISFSSFGAGSTVKQSIPLTLNVPGNDIGLIAEARCNSTTILADSSQITIYAGGSGTGAGSNGGSTGNTGGTGSGTGNCGGTGQPACPVIPAGNNQTYTYNITNPLKGAPNDIFGIINILTQWIMYISIPLAVLFIMYAGFLMLTAGPVPANFDKGKKILTQVIIGLAIIFIGKGFVSLIISIVQLGGTSPTTTQTQTQSNGGGTSGTGNGTAPPAGATLPETHYDCGANGQCVVDSTNNYEYSDFTSCQDACGGGATTGGKRIGQACAAGAQPPDCDLDLVCGANSVCQRPGGNAAGETCYTDANCQTGTTCQDNPLGSDMLCTAN